MGSETHHPIRAIEILPGSRKYKPSTPTVPSYQTCVYMSTDEDLSSSIYVSAL